MAGAAEVQSTMQPFSTPNQSPLALTLLPFSSVSAHVPEKGTTTFRPFAAYSSIFTKQRSDSSSIFLDMELLTVSLGCDYVLAPGLQVGLELPFVYYYGGFLDHTIQEYHDIFGFPNGGREDVPNNEVHYQVSHKGRTLIDRTSNGSGIGDVKLFGKFAVVEESAKWPAVSGLAQISFPTGSETKGIGAGGPLFGAGVALDKRYGRFSFNLNGLFFYLQESDFLSELSINNAFAGSFTTGFALTPKWTLMVQFNGATPLFEETGVDGLDNGILQVLLGFQYAWNPKNALRVAFIEDPIQDTSPDFTLSIEWSARF